MESILPLKALVLIEALNKHAKSLEHIFKTDDDSMLDVLGLKNVLAKEKKRGKDVDYWGTCWPSSPVIRDPSHKWYIPESTYSKSHYPLYCVGAGYLISKNLAECITGKMENLLPFMPMEDVSLSYGSRPVRISIPQQCPRENRIA